MKKGKKALATILAGGILLSMLAACGGGGGSANTPSGGETPSGGSSEFPEQVSLTFGISGAAGQGTAIALQNAIDEIAERSGGAIQIDLVTDGALGNEASLLAQAMEGSIDFAGVGIGTVANYSEALSVFQLPFLINSYEQEAQVLLSDEWQAVMDQANADLGTATVLGGSEFGMRHFATIDMPIETRADIAGV